MAEAPDNPTLPSSDEGQPDSWAQVWQLPVLILGITLLIVGLILTSREEGEPDDFPGKLDEISTYLKANNLEKAQEEVTFLAERIGRSSKLDQARFEMYRGDLIYHQQRENNWDLEQNHQRIHDRYVGSRKLGQHFDPLRLQRWAETLVALGKEEQALAKLDQITDGPAERRYSVIRKIIERRRVRLAGRDPHSLVRLIERFVQELEKELDPQRRRSGRIWAASLRARALLETGEPHRGIGYLQKQIARFLDEDAEDQLAPLNVLMGKAYQQIGEFDEAERWFLGTQQKLLATDPINADVLVGLGQLALAKTDAVRIALEHFSQAEIKYPLTPAYFDALVGYADCEARLGGHSAAVERFARAVMFLLEDPFRSDQQVNQFVSDIRNHHSLNFDRQDYIQALAYLQVLPPLFQNDLPSDLLVQFAVTHERIAQQRNAEAMARKDETTAGSLPAEIGVKTTAQRLAFQDAAIHFEKAAQYYLEHARTVTISDDDAFGTSLWKAATSYDKAQQWKDAIQVYAEFVKARPSDPRQLEAINHLALAYQADGQFEPAAELFKELITEHPKSLEAYASLVPLARCHIAMGKLDHAVRVLRNVLTDHPAIRPDSPRYREALIELSKLFYRDEQFEEAIERLNETLERYGDSSLGPTLRFMLADAYRQSVEQIEKVLGEQLTQSKRLSHQGERSRRLEQAQIFYSQVISLLETRDASTYSPTETLFYRNAYFYRADCAYDLGRFEQSISLYDLAAKRWEDHPASMVALIQIVNAYCELGRTREAKVANDRARWQLNRISDEAFEDPDLPMNRERWQDWLRWASELKLFGEAQARAG